MGKVFVPGMRVVHPGRGSGTILEALPRGKVRVRFDGSPSFPVLVSAKELQEEGEGSSRPGRRGKDGGRRRKGTSPPEAGARKPAADPRRKASYRQTLEALRLGVVPRDHLLEYTVGRNKEISELDSFLKKGKGLRLIWGYYGSGKTHLLDLLERAALREGFVVSRIVLDPKEVPPSHPKRLFNAFLKAMRYPREISTGWVPLFSRLTEEEEFLRPESPLFSRYLSPVLFALASEEEEAVGWASDYIEGYPMEMADFWSVLKEAGWEGPRPLSLPDFRTFGRVYTHLLGALSVWAARAGFRGLLLLADEVEYVDSLDSIHRRLTREVLAHFAAASLPRKALAFDPEKLYKGGREVHRSFPIRFARNQPLSVVLALTPLPQTSHLVRTILQDVPEFSLYLEDLGKGAHLRLVRRVRDLYAKAYPSFTPSQEDLQRIRVRLSRALDMEEISPRDVVRGVVSALDARRLGKEPFQETHRFLDEGGTW